MERDSSEHANTLGTERGDAGRGEPPVGRDLFGCDAQAKPGRPAAGKRAGKRGKEASRIDFDRVDIHARGLKAAETQPPVEKPGAEGVILIQGAAGKVPFGPLDGVWRAIWAILKRARDSVEADVIYSPAMQIADGKLMASAIYSTGLDSADSPVHAEVLRKLELGTRLLQDPCLWSIEDLEARYANLPWQEMVETVRSARDEISGEALPCAIEIEHLATRRILSVGPALAPSRPIPERPVKEIVRGYCVGHLFAEDFHISVGKKLGQKAVRIDFKPTTEMISRVESVIGANRPLIEVKVDVMYRAELVVSRTLTDLRILAESLLVLDSEDSRQ